MELAFNPLISDSNLKGYYKLEDVNNTIGGTNLTESGTISYTAGKYGNCAELSTGNNALYANTNFSIAYNSAQSMAIWVNPNAQPSSGDWYTYSTIGYATGDVYYYIAYFNNSGTLQLRFSRDRYNIGVTNSLYTTTLSNGTWYFLTMTYDGTNIRGYLNGSLVAGPTGATGTGNNGATDRIVAGSILDVNGRYGKAKLDDWSIYSKCLSDTEIASLYEEKKASFIALV